MQINHADHVIRYHVSLDDEEATKLREAGILEPGRDDGHHPVMSGKEVLQAARALERDDDRLSAVVSQLVAASNEPLQDSSTSWALWALESQCDLADLEELAATWSARAVEAETRLRELHVHITEAIIDGSLAVEWFQKIQ